MIIMMIKHKQGRIHDQLMRLPIGRGSIGSCPPFPHNSLITLKFKPYILTSFKNIAQTDQPMDGRTDGRMDGQTDG